MPVPLDAFTPDATRLILVGLAKSADRILLIVPATNSPKLAPELRGLSCQVRERCPRNKCKIRPSKSVQKNNPLRYGILHTRMRDISARPFPSEARLWRNNDRPGSWSGSDSCTS